MNTSNNSDLFHYLRDVSTHSQFATSVFLFLVEERHTCHQELQNSTITAKTSLKVEDIVIYHISAQS